MPPARSAGMRSGMDSASSANHYDGIERTAPLRDSLARCAASISSAAFARETQRRARCARQRSSEALCAAPGVGVFEFDAAVFRSAFQRSGSAAIVQCNCPV